MLPWRPLIVFFVIAVGATTAIAALCAARGWDVSSPEWALLAPLAMWAPALARLVARCTDEMPSRILDEHGAQAIGDRHGPAAARNDGSTERLEARKRCVDVAHDDGEHDDARLVNPAVERSTAGGPDLDDLDAALKARCHSDLPAQARVGRPGA